MNVKVKICGVRDLNAAKVSVDCGADFLGFNFVPTSKRFIDPSKAREIIDLVRDRVKVVGVFQDADIDYVKSIIENLKLDFAQLHGSEEEDYINNVGIPVIKSIKIDYKPKKSNSKYLLLDRSLQGRGEMVDFTKASKLASQAPLFLAGGLTPENVASALLQVKPFAADVAGGVETDGVQDIKKIKLFIENSKKVAI